MSYYSSHGFDSSDDEHGEDGGPTESVEHDVDLNGVSIMFYDDQVAIESDDADYPIFIPFETWRAFVSASIRKYGEENIL